MPSVLRSLTIALNLTSTGVDKGAASATRSLGTVEQAAQRHQETLDKVGTVAIGVGGAMVAGFGAAVGAAMDFDKQMSNVGAVSNATGKDLDGLRQAALKAGKDTSFSATEAAKAESELAKVGISAADIMGGALTGSLSLAAAGQLDLEEAATLSGQAMKIFNLQGKDVGKIADVLAAGANKSAADVHQLGESLRAGGQTASQFGLGLTDTVGVLAAFSDNALIGSDAGTSLKTMLLHLANPTDKTRALMGELGIAAYDTGGKFVGVGNLAGQLQTKLSGLTQEQRDAALAQIFGSDAMRGASILYKIGEKGVQDYTKAVDQQGAASQVAAKNMDNLAGDLEKLRGSIETALIQGGSAATGALRGMTKAADGLVGIFNSMPQPVQGAITVIGGLAGIVTAAAGAFVLGAPKVAAFKESLNDMGPKGQRFGKAITSVGSFLTGPWGIALGVGTLALGYFAAKHAEAEQQVKDLTATLDKQTGAITNDTRALVVNTLSSEGLLQKAKDAGINVGLFTDAMLGNQDAIAQVNRQLEATQTVMVAVGGRGVSASGQWRTLSGDATKLRDAINGQNGTLHDSVEQWKLEHEASKGAAGASDVAGKSIEATGNKAATAAQQVQTLADKVRGFNSLAGDATTTSIDFKNHIDEMREAFKKNALQIDHQTGAFRLNNKVNRDNATLVIDAIRKAGEHAAAVAKDTGSVKKGNAAFNEEINVLRGVLEKQHLSRSEIDKLIGKYVDLKNKVNAATKGIHDRRVLIEVKAGGTLVGFKVQGGTVLNADGGILPGWSPGQDVHMFYSPTGGTLGLSGGEAVMRPEWTKAVGPAAVEQMNAAARSGGVPAVKQLLDRGVGRAGLRGEGAFFAGGGIISRGTVTGIDSVRAMAARANILYGIWAKNIGKGVSKKISDAMGGGPGAARGLAWARSQAGKPYVWGGVGPRGYDCSGLWSALTNVIHGKHPYSRLFSTGSFGASSGPGGYVRNRSSAVRVGVTDAGVGHMAGTIGKVNIESRGSRGVLVGSAARGANNGLFTRRYGLKFDEGGVLPPGHTPAYNGTGKPEYVFTQRQMQHGGGPGNTTVHVTVQVAPGANRYEIGKELYDVLKPYMDKSKRKLPA